MMEELKKEMVAYVFRATKEGPEYEGIRKIEIVKDILSGKRIIRMSEIPAYDDVRPTTEDLSFLLMGGATVVIYGWDETSRTGLHWCEVKTRFPIIVQKVIPTSLLATYDVPGIKYTEDTPAGKIEYAVVGKEIDLELEVVPTVFLSTLKHLVEDEKAKVEYEDEYEITFFVTDKEVKEKLKMYNLGSMITKRKIPKQFLESTIVIPF